MKRFLLLAVIALSPQFAAAAKPISVFSNFEGGALGKVERVSETHFRCGVKGESDQDGRNRYIGKSSARLRRAERCCCSRSRMNARLTRKRKSSG